MNALATSLQTYFTTFARSQRDLSSNTIGSYRDTWRMLLKYLTATLGVAADARTRTRQQRQDPQRPADRDPLRAQPCPARPSRTRRDDHPGPRDTAQTHDLARGVHQRGRR